MFKSVLSFRPSPWINQAWEFSFKKRNSFFIVSQIWQPVLREFGNFPLFFLLRFILMPVRWLYGIKSKSGNGLTFDSHCKPIAALFFIVVLFEDKFYVMCWCSICTTLDSSNSVQWRQRLFQWFYGKWLHVEIICGGNAASITMRIIVDLAFFRHPDSLFSGN